MIFGYFVVEENCTMVNLQLLVQIFVIRYIKCEKRYKSDIFNFGFY